MQILLKLLFSTLFFLAGDGAQAVEPTSQSKVADEVAMARLKMDSEQATYNRRLEQEKLDVERMKAWITGGSLMVPLMVAALTFALGVWNQSQQARLQRESQENAERAQFELKAAEIVMNEKGPVGAKNKARALKALFPTKLPDDFVTSFKPDDFEGPKVESFEAKRVFFETAASGTADIKALATLWAQLFPGDKWPTRLLGEPTANQPPSSKA